MSRDNSRPPTTYQNPTADPASNAPQPSARERRADFLRSAANLMEEALQKGWAIIVSADDATVDVHQTRHTSPAPTPMTSHQAERLQKDVHQVNQAVTRGQCTLEFRNDPQGHPRVRFSVTQPQPDLQPLMESLQNIVRHTLSGGAVPARLPGNALMLMPRWPDPRQRAA